MKKGFTLIELLVVVLIIGILAAVALPQYRRAVAKSRVTEMFSMIGILDKAVTMYRLSNPYNLSGGNTWPDMQTILAAGGYELSGGTWGSSYQYKTKNYQYTMSTMIMGSPLNWVVMFQHDNNSGYTADFSLSLSLPLELNSTNPGCFPHTDVGTYICQEFKKQYPNLSWWSN